jgi:hypothetical protein
VADPARRPTTTGSATAPATGPTADWRTYQDPKQRFRFKYPAGWEQKAVTPGHAPVAVIFSEASEGNTVPGGEKGTHQFHANMNVGIASLPATIDVKSVAGSLKGRFAKRWPDFHLVEESDTTLGGVPALKLVYTYTDTAGDPMLENVQLFAVADKTLYTLTLGTGAEQFARFEPTAAAIIQSFEPGEPTAK